MGRLESVLQGMKEECDVRESTITLMSAVPAQIAFLSSLSRNTWSLSAAFVCCRQDQR